MLRVLLLALAVMTAGMPSARSAEIVNATPAGIAIDGFDAVAYFTRGCALKGRSEFKLRHQGVDWLFATSEHRDAFAAEPDRYAPRYNGFCAVAVSEGAAAEVDFINGWAIVEGALYMNWSASVRRTFLDEMPERLRASRRNWPDVHSDMLDGIRQIARHAHFPGEGISHPQPPPGACTRSHAPAVQ